MKPALVTPVKLSLRRITFICCACIVLACAGCFHFDIPDQDAVINIYADKITSNDIIKLDTSAVYDTTAATLSCILHFDSSKTTQRNMPITLFSNGKKIFSQDAIDSIVELGWINGGVYAMQIGNPSEYPCYNIHNINILPGRKCTLHVYKIPKP